MSSVEKALQLLRSLPRVALNNIRDLPEFQKIRHKMVSPIYVRLNLISVF